MFGLSVSHLLIFAVIIILLFGTSRLRSIGSDLGSAIKGFKDSVEDKSKKDDDPSSRT